VCVCFRIGFAVIKIIATLEDKLFRVLAAKTILSLLDDTSIHSLIFKEPVALVITAIIQKSHGEALTFALEAAASASRFEVFKVQLIGKGYVAAVMCASLSHEVSSLLLTEAVARSLCNITSVIPSIEWLVIEANIMVVLHGLNSFGKTDSTSAAMIVYTLRNLSINIKNCIIMCEQGAMRLLAELLEKYSDQSSMLGRLGIYFLQNLGREEKIHDLLITQNLMELLQVIVFTVSEEKSESGEEAEVRIVKQPKADLNEIDAFNVVRVVDLVSVSPSCRNAIVSKGAVDLFRALSGYIDDSSRLAMARYIYV